MCLKELLSVAIMEYTFRILGIMYFSQLNDISFVMLLLFLTEQFVFPRTLCQKWLSSRAMLDRNIS